MAEDFEWPCHKRIAHGPHKREQVNDWGVGPVLYVVGDGKVTQIEDCPGVAAHPDVMIGRQ